MKSGTIYNDMASILGIDCGDVIFYTGSGALLPDVIETLQSIVRSQRFDKIYIISRVNPFTKVLFLFRLWRRNFWTRTGISREHIYFCPGFQNKSAIAESLGITHFVDDRLQ